MNGFIIKELLQLRREKLWTAIIMLISVLLCAVGAVTRATSFIIFMLNSYFAAGIMGVDVGTAWNRWCVTTPLGRRKVIESKYFILALREVAAIFIAFLGVVIFKTLGLNSDDYLYNFQYITLAFSLLILADTVTLVLVFWRGSYRGSRIAFVINVIFLVVLTVFAQQLVAFEYLPLIFIITVIIRAASRPLSIWLYERRSL